MEKETALKAKEIIEELKDLERYREFLLSSHKHNVNFQINQHYGRVASWEYVVIDKKHNPLLIKVVEDIIDNLNNKLSNL